MAVTAPWMYPQTLLSCAWKWPKTAPSVMLMGRAHPAILANSRWRAVSCIDPRLEEKLSDRNRLSSNIAPSR